MSVFGVPDVTVSNTYLVASEIGFPLELDSGLMKKLFKGSHSANGGPGYQETRSIVDVRVLFVVTGSICPRAKDVFWQGRVRNCVARRVIKGPGPTPFLAAKDNFLPNSVGFGDLCSQL